MRNCKKSGTESHILQIFQESVIKFQDFKNIWLTPAVSNCRRNIQIQLILSSIQNIATKTSHKKQFVGTVFSSFTKVWCGV